MKTKSEHWGIKQSVDDGSGTKFAIINLECIDGRFYFDLRLPSDRHNVERLITIGEVDLAEIDALGHGLIHAADAALMRIGR